MRDEFELDDHQRSPEEDRTAHETETRAAPEVQLGSDQPSSERARSLEAKYIDLLEQKIKSLEATLEKDPKDKQKSSGSRGKPDGKDAPTNAAPPSKGGPIRFRERIMKKNDIEEERDWEPSETPWLDLKSLDGDMELHNTSDAPSHELTWVRMADDKGQYIRSEFTVEATELKVLLSVVLSHYPNLHLLPNTLTSSDDVRGEPVTFHSPFVPLLHNWESLEALWPRTSNAATADTLEESVPEMADIESLIEKTGLRTDPESQPVWVANFLAKDNNILKARRQLKRLMIAVSQAREVKRYFSTLGVHKKAKTVQFDFLWTLFPPGEIIFSKVFMNEPQLFLVKSCSNQQTFVDEQGFTSDKLENPTKILWRLDAWTYDWNGRKFERTSLRFEFDQFPGSRPINTLHCYPLKFYEGVGDQIIGNGTPAEILKSVLLERGQRFKDLCTKSKGSQMLDYHGNAISHGAGFQSKYEREMALFFLHAEIRDRNHPRIGKGDLPEATNIQHVHGRVMVDFQAFIRNSPPSEFTSPMGKADLQGKGDECKCSNCSSNASIRRSQKVHWDAATAETKFEDLQYMLCPPRVLGYHLEKKSWLELNIAKRFNDEDADNKTVEEGKRYLEDIAQPIKEEAFEKLQLTKTQKTLIKDLVKSHVGGANSQPRLMEDLMEGKGRGLVILLHGPPGVGKTLTAESVAQLAGKPLFPVGVSDIGTDSAEVESKFHQLFELAAKWQAVMLFDEADVFLESRSSHTSDLQRNALVSVLLKVLEYYDGILILTTNRIREFDIAVQSRVNLGIKYEDLEREQKNDIFDNFMGQLREDQVEDRGSIKEWFKNDEEAKEWVKPLNGRQIRNILFSAASLAVNDKGVLKLEHVKKMTKSTATFHDTVKTIIEDGRRKAEAGRV